MIEQLQQAQFLLYLGGFGALREHGIKIDDIRLFAQGGQVFQRISRDQLNPLHRGRKFSDVAGPFQAIFKEGRDHRVALKHLDPKSGGGKKERVASEAGGGVDEQRLQGLSNLGCLDQEFAASIAKASPGGRSGKIDPQCTGQLQISGLAQFEPFRGETQQERGGLRISDQWKV